MYKMSEEWTTEKESNVISSPGSESHSILIDMSEEDFCNRMQGILSLISPSRSELRHVELAIRSGNRIRVVHTVLVLVSSYRELLEETQRQGIDSEDIEQHGLDYESYESKLFSQSISYENNNSHHISH